MNRNKRFTLVELLVVIAIIAILASMLLPALQGAKYKAKVVNCVNTLKGVARVMHMYAGDFDEYFPEVGNEYTGSGGWVQAAQAGA